MGAGQDGKGSASGCQRVCQRKGKGTNILAVMQNLDPLARDFILFCVRRCGVQWPALYDEMCWVAGHRLFHDMGYNELGGVGLSFGLQDIENTILMIDSIIARG